MRLPMNTSLAMLKPSGIRRINALAVRASGVYRARARRARFSHARCD